jgi:rhomboid family GlyGly-CTERM serine protease
MRWRWPIVSVNTRASLPLPVLRERAGVRAGVRTIALTPTLSRRTGTGGGDRSTRPETPWQWPIVTLALVALATVVQLVPGAAAAVQYERAAAASGQAWKLFTGHLAHWSFEHFAWDVAVLVVLGVACEVLVGSARTCSACTGAMVAITFTLRVAQPGLETYRGLSGIDSGLFGLLLATLVPHLLRNRKRRAAVFVLGCGCAFLAKLVFESATRQSVFVNSTSNGFVPVPLAHAIGFVAGCAAGALTWRDRRFAPPTDAATIAAT